MALNIGRQLHQPKEPFSEVGTAAAIGCAASTLDWQVSVSVHFPGIMSPYMRLLKPFRKC